MSVLIVPLKAVVLYWLIVVGIVSERVLNNLQGLEPILYTFIESPTSESWQATRDSILYKGIHAEPLRNKWIRPATPRTLR